MIAHKDYIAEILEEIIEYNVKEEKVCCCVVVVEQA
jgi:serine/threonine protein kinase